MKYKVITRQSPMSSIELGEMYFKGWDLVTIIPIRDMEYIHYFREVKKDAYESK